MNSINALVTFVKQQVKYVGKEHIKRIVKVIVIIIIIIRKDKFILP